MHKMICLLLAFLLWPASIPVAGDLDEPDFVSLETVIAKSKEINPDKVVLTVKGKINNVNPAYFDLDTVMRLRPDVFETTNHWTGKKEKYTGVGFIQLLTLLGLDETASVADVIASNNYRISIKISDLKKYEYLLAYKIDEKLYSAYEPKFNKGPLAIAINFDKHPELDREIYKHQLVWFVETIIVR